MRNDLFRLTKLEMTNFRCFRKMREPLEFEPDMTVIVARNGGGKTAVLDAIRISLGTFTRGMSRLSQAGIARHDASLTTLRAGQGRGADYPVRIEVEGMVDTQPSKWARVRESEHGRTTTKEAQVIADFGAYLRACVTSDGCEIPELPVLAFYGTGRLWKGEGESAKDREGAKLPPAFENCFVGYEDALTANSIYAQVKRWLCNADLCANSFVEQQTDIGRLTAKQYRAVVKAVNAVLRGTGFRDPHYNTRYEEITLIEDRRGQNDEAIAVPVSWTSDGVKAAFSLVADIAYRCARLNPSFGEETCARTQGLVMIDEVDLFLHPAWQQRILDDLRKIFPRIQFVVTTHSPQVVSSVEQRCLRIIDADGQIGRPTVWTEGVESSRILEDVFGTKPYPAENSWRKRVAQYIQAVDDGRGNEPEVKREGDELDKRFKGRDTAFDLARFDVEESAWEAENAPH